MKTTKPVKYVKTERRVIPRRIQQIKHIVTYECQAPSEMVVQNGAQVCMEQQQYAMAPDAVADARSGRDRKRRRRGPRS